MERKKSRVMWGVICILLILNFSTGNGQEINLSESLSYDPDEILPIDPEITIGQLSNGLQYYIRENKKPENRAQFWLVVNAGSVMEDDDQLGLAHFTEHMAFNGTRHFSKHQIIDYLESIGMKFGPEINAYTSFDETVFMLQVPTINTRTVEKGIQILEDWAHWISFEDDEIEKERGVVIEEWRLGRGADMRMFNKQLPVIFQDSRYAKRLPIGNKEVLGSFDPDALRRFYKDWYRPDLMCVVAVGDFDKFWIKNLITKYFGWIPNPENPRKRELYKVPDHEETLITIATDPEATSTGIAVYYKTDPVPVQTMNDYKGLLMERLYTTMLNHRLYEQINQADPPYLFCYSGKSTFIRAKSIYSLTAGIKEDGILRGLEGLLTEASRVHRYGFTQTELDRIKEKIFRQIEKEFKEHDKTLSQVIAKKCAGHYLKKDPLPGIKYEYELIRKLLPGIPLEEVNLLMNDWMTDENQIVLVNAPYDKNVIVPTKEELSSVFRKVEALDINPYVDLTALEPLVETAPEPGKIINEVEMPGLGITEWTLPNGVRVVLKPTDFKNDEIRFQAYSPGGNSLVHDRDYMSANVATDIIRESGVGNFSLAELNKKLTGKVVSVFPYINPLTEGLLGSSSPSDMETLFQLIYLYITKPRKDPDSFLSYQSRMKGFFENRSGSPESAFYDTIQVTLGQYHFRERPWSVDLLDELDHDILYDFYKDRFADASDFTFFFVGNFTKEKIRPLVETYLGGLTSLNRQETWRDPGLSPPKGIIRKSVHKGVEQKSLVQLVFSGPVEYSAQNIYVINSLTSILRIRLRETMREDLSGTYGVRIWSSCILYPNQQYNISISFGCSPERVDELLGSLFKQIKQIKTKGPEDILLTKVKESQNRQYETNLKENSFWLRSLLHSYYTEQDPIYILRYPQLLQSLSRKKIKEAAQKYFDMENYVQVVLYPENLN